MYTRCFERNERDYEIINISEYGFEWYVNNELVRSGLVEPDTLEETIELLLDEGFVEVE